MSRHQVSLRERLSARWEQGMFTRTDQRWILIILLIQANIRGFDYLRGSTPSGHEWDVLEAAFTPQQLGLWFIFASTLTFCGVIFKWHVGVWLGHGFLWVAYWALALATSIAIDWSIETALRIPGAFFGAGVIHFIWWLRTGRDPIQTGSSNPSEEIATPGEDSQ